MSQRPGKSPIRAENGRDIRRVPRRVHVGRGYVVEVVLVQQRIFRERDFCEDGEELDGYWESFLGQDELIAGRVYIHQGLSPASRWDTYWHEMVHALNDIMAWDRKEPLAT